MWFVEWLLSIVTFPIEWFWNMYESYKEEKSGWKVIGLFAISLSGLILFGLLFLWIAFWLVTWHFEIIIVLVFILWLYAYVKSKMNTVETVNDMSDEMQELSEQAKNNYPMVRNIMYQTLKQTAENIGGIIPRLLADIEVLEGHYIISKDICFYQFRLEKSDIRMRYQTEELNEFEKILQNVISRKIQAGDFPVLGFEKFLDNYGNVYDAVYIDVIEDMDTCFIIQAVLYSPKYADYLREKRMNQQSVNSDAGVPNASWGSKQ